MQLSVTTEVCHMLVCSQFCFRTLTVRYDEVNESGTFKLYKHCPFYAIEKY